MLGLAGLPSLLQFAGFLFMPRSPRWLASRGRWSEAEAVLARIRPAGADVAEELADIERTMKEDDDGSGGGGWRVAARAFRHPPTRRAILLCCSLMVFQQVSGINTLMYYSASVVLMAGIGDTSSAIWISAGISGLYLLSCFLGVVFVERLGRRRLLLLSLAGVFLSLILIAVGFQLADSGSPAITVQQIDNNNNTSSCSAFTHCSECVQECF